MERGGTDGWVGGAEGRLGWGRRGGSTVAASSASLPCQAMRVHAVSLAAPRRMSCKMMSYSLLLLPSSAARQVQHAQRRAAPTSL